MCRITLILKGANGLIRVDGLRPITVAPLLVRVLHRVLARRLSDVPLNIVQPGFHPLNGTLAKSIILQTIIKIRREAAAPYQITFIDL